MSLCGDKLIVGTAGRRVLVWYLHNTGFVQQRRESSLKYQTRCIRAFPDKQGYVLSSIEGMSFYGQKLYLKPIEKNILVAVIEHQILEDFSLMCCSLVQIIATETSPSAVKCLLQFPN